MRSLIAIGIGFALLGLCLGGGWLVGGPAKMKIAALVFILAFERSQLSSVNPQA